MHSAERQVPGGSFIAGAQLLRALFCIAVLLTCGRIMAMNQADPDLWGHVQYGRDLLNSGVLPATTTWSFAAAGSRWVNHELLAEILLAWTEDHFGRWGLTAGKYLISLVLMWLVYRSARRAGVSPLTIGPMCLVMALAMEFHWHFRPQVLGYLFFALMLVILDAAFADWPAVASGTTRSGKIWRLLWLLPLMTIWANTHGSFPAGICVAVAFLGFQGMELLLVRRRMSNEKPAIGTGKLLVGLLATGSGLLVATLANPYGTEMYTWLWDALRIPCAEIDDWAMLPFWTSSRESLCAWGIVLTSLVAIVRAPRRDWPRILVLGLVAWQAISHIRHLPMLAMTWGMWMAVPVDAVRADIVRAIKDRQSLEERPALRKRMAPWLAPLLCIWIVLTAAMTWPRLSHLQVSTSDYPVDAFAFLAKHRLSGRTIVTFNWAQYAIGLFANQELDSSVAFDGRYRTCYSQEVLDRYFDLAFGKDYSGPRYRSPASGPIDPEQSLTRDNPELVVISRLQRPSERIMRRHADRWTLLYQDGLSQIWGRADLFDNLASPRYLSPENRVIGDGFPRGLVEYPAYPRPHQNSPQFSRGLSLDAEWGDGMSDRPGQSVRSRG
jgi:hypothetical protein